MLDLEPVPERPPQVDGEPNHTQEQDDEHSHDEEDRPSLLAGNGDRGQPSIESAVRSRRA